MNLAPCGRHWVVLQNGRGCAFTGDDPDDWQFDAYDLIVNVCSKPTEYIGTCVLHPNKLLELCARHVAQLRGCAGCRLHLTSLRSAGA